MKLSELPRDTQIMIYDRDEVISVEDFINNYYGDAEESIFTTYKETQKFDIADIVYDLSEDDTYEDWYDDVMSEIMHNQSLMQACADIQEILLSHPTYFPESEIELDWENIERS